MARARTARRSASRRTSTTRTTTTRERGGAGRVLLPVVIIGTAIAGVLLFERLARAGQQNVTPPIAPPPPYPLPPPPPPPDQGPPVEAVADAPLPAGAQRARVTATVLNVREQPSVNSRTVSRVRQGTGLAIIEAGPPSPGPGSQAGWQKIRTPRGVDGYVSADYISYGETPNTLLPFNTGSPFNAGAAPVVGGYGYYPTYY